MTRAGGLARGASTPRRCSAASTGWSAASCPTSRDTSQAPQPPSPRAERGDRRGAGRRRSAACAARRTRRRGTRAGQHAGAARGAAAAQAGAQAGRRRTPVERATIEIVALLFQSILTEDAHPGHGARLVRAPADAGAARGRQRARLLRHHRPSGAPADRPHGRVRDGLRLVAAAPSATLLEKEIKRVVQVVEAYPDTGRRVFQTVLTEFEKFLEHYFRNENEASQQGRLAGRSRSSSARRWRSSTRSSCARCSTRCRCRKACASSCSRSGPTCWRRPRSSRRSRRRDQGDEARRRRPDLVGQRQGLARRARRGDPPPAAAAEDAARRHGRRPACRCRKQDEHIQRSTTRSPPRSPPRRRRSRTSGSRS